MSYNSKKITIFLSLIMIFPFLFCIGLDTDEPFTMGLISHSYHSLINLTAYDVHPPLYYIILKSFVTVFSFGTNNIFVQIFLSRLLSIIFSLVGFVFLMRLQKLIKIKSSYISFLLYILLMGQQLTTIRMYSLCLMLISIELYIIAKAYISWSYKYIPIMFVLTSMLMYSHYFAGMISGLLLICFAMLFIIQKKYKQSLGLIISGLLSLIAFIPWISSFLFQIKLQENSANIPNTSFVSLIVKTILPISIVIILFFINKSNMNNITTIFLSVSSIVITIVFISLLVLRITNTKYVLPIFIPYTLINLNLLFMKKNTLTRIVILLSLTLIIGRFAHSFEKQIVKLDIPSISFIHTFYNIKNSPDENINVHQYGLDKYYWDKKYGGGGGNAIYLNSIGKKINDNNYINTYQVLGNGNKKLFKAVFPNIEHFSISNPSNQKNKKNKLDFPLIKF